jgi:HlyD family secretion protein
VRRLLGLSRAATQMLATAASSTDGATSSSIAELSSGLEIEAKVPEASIARIQPGQRVEIHSDSYPDATFEGQVSLIAPRAIQEDKVTSFRVKVKLSNGLDQLKSGMNVRLAFMGTPVRNAIAVPLAAIITRKDGQKGVWRAEGGKAKFQPVKLGAESSDQAQILEGLNRSDRIFLSPPPGEIVPGVDNTEGL